MTDDWPLLWLCGPSGVGKTSVGWEIFTQLDRAGVPVGYLDADQIGLGYPAPADDPQNHRVKARNLGAMARTLRAAGARCLVLSGGVQHADEVAGYAAAVPDATRTLCRLRVAPEELRARFLGRGWQPALLAENEEVAEALDRSTFADFQVETTGLSVPEVARRVRERAGDWPRTGTPPPAVTVPEPLAPDSSVPDSLVPDPPTGTAQDADSRDADSQDADSQDADAHPPVPVLWVCGARGVGKSEVAFSVFAQLLGAGTPAAYVDLAQLGFLRPAPADDPSGHRLRARGLAAVWPTYRAAGARCLVLSGGVDDPDAVRGYLEAVPEGRFSLVRLHAGAEQLTARILRRGRGEGPPLPGDTLRGRPQPELLAAAEAATREAEALERARIGGPGVATDGRTVTEVAAEVRRVLPPHLGGAAPAGSPESSTEPDRTAVGSTEVG